MVFSDDPVPVFLFVTLKRKKLTLKLRVVFVRLAPPQE